MRNDADHRDIARQRVARAAPVVCFAGRNVHFVVRHPEAADERGRLAQGFGHGFVHKVDADGALVRLLFAGRVIVELEHEVAALFQIPPHACGQAARCVADAPSAERAAGQKAHAAKQRVARLRCRGIEFAARAFVIEKEHRVMHDALVAGMKLDGGDEFVLGRGDRDDKVLQDVRAVGWHGEWLGHLHHEVGFSKQPALGELRRRR